MWLKLGKIKTIAKSCPRMTTFQHKSPDYVEFSMFWNALRINSRRFKNPGKNA